MLVRPEIGILILKSNLEIAKNDGPETLKGYTCVGTLNNTQ